MHATHRTMIPLFSTLSGRRLSVAEMADLLERHIGDGANPRLCVEAARDLQRIRAEYPSYYLRAALRSLDREDDACTRVRQVIASLRAWQHFSGA